jgi:hypothetical protein
VRLNPRQSSTTATTPDTPRGNRDALKIREPPHDLVLLHLVDMIDVHNEHCGLTTFKDMSSHQAYSPEFVEKLFGKASGVDR